MDWSESNQKKKIINVPNELYESGCIHDVEEGLKVSMSLKHYCAGAETMHGRLLKSLIYFQAAEKIGYPIMVKASEGGGGKGIRKVNCAEDFPNLFRQVKTTWPPYILSGFILLH